MTMHSFFNRHCHCPIPRRAAAILVALAWTSLAFCAKTTPSEALLKAARKGNAQKAASLVHSVDPSGVVEALIEAARLGHLNVVQAMVANGADINGNVGGGEQPIRKTELLVQSSGSFDFHPLTMLDLIHLPDCLIGRVESPRSPLIAAARAGKLEVVKWLVEQRADLDLQGGARIFKDLQHVGGTGTFRPVCEENIGNNALSEAILAGQVSIVQILVERGADLSRRVVFRSAATDPAIVGFYGVGVLLQDANGLVHEAVDYGKHIWISNDGLIKTDLKIQLQQELTIRELASYSTHPEIKALAGVQTGGAVQQGLRAKCIPFADGSVDKVLAKKMPLPPKECREVLGWMRDSRLSTLYDAQPKQ